MADQKYTVEVDFTLGKQSKAKLESEIADVKRKATASTAGPGQQGGPAFATQADLDAWKKEYDTIQSEMAELGATQKEMWEKGRKANAEYQKQLRDSSRTISQIKEDVLKSTIAQKDSQAEALKEMRQRATALRAESSVLRRSAADLEFFSRAALVSGTAILGGVFAYANKYVKEAEYATKVTVQWKEAQDDMKKSSARIGEVFAKEALPFLVKAAGFMRDAAAFIEAHPAIVPAAVNAGLILIGIGTIGKAVSTGIRLTADALTIQSAYIRYQAATMDTVSADKYLLAAEINAEAAGVATGGSATKGVLGGFAAALGQVVVLLGSFAAGLIAGDRLFDKIEKRDVKFADYMVEIKQAIAIDAKNLGDIVNNSPLFRLLRGGELPSEDLGMKWFEKVATSLGLLKSKADDAAGALDNIDLGSVANSPAKEQILDAYEDLLKDEAEMTRKYKDDIRKVNEDALKDELDANRRYANDVRKINENLAQSLAKAASDFAQANADAERKYAEEHDQILQDQADDLARIQEQLQEKLRKLEQDNQDRINELLAQRDAVGLVKQQRKYLQDRADAIREANLESRQRREETQKRLAELRQQFEQERAERLADYNARTAELRQEAANRLKELQLQHQEELSKIREQRNARLKELDVQYKSERERRYQYFVAQLKDLDAVLLGEKKIRDARHTQMLADLDAWLVKYRANMANGLNSLTAPPIKDSGGYVNRGLYRMAWDNQKEFVLSGPTTRAAERIFGQNLSQEMIIRGLTGGSNTSYVDQRRMEMPLSKEQMALTREYAIEAISRAIGGQL